MSNVSKWRLTVADAQDGCKLRRKDFCCHTMRNPNGGEQISKKQDELQWIVAQRLLSALTIPGFK